MKFITNNGTLYDINIISYKQDILINYNLMETSSSNYISIDRGASTDRYESSITVRGHKDVISSLVEELTLLRLNNKQITLSDFDVPIFGDNVDHSNPINCVISDISHEKSPVLNVGTIDISFIPTDLSFIGQVQLPTLTCLSHSWEGYADWKTHVNETYNRNNYFIDRTADTYVFKGNYNLSLDETKNLLQYWKNKRGNIFTINEPDFGTYNMFGGSVTDISHNVIILDISYNYISPVRRDVTIELVKVG